MHIIKLQERIVSLEVTVKQQEARIKSIEAEDTRNKLIPVTSTPSCQSRHQAEGGSSEQNNEKPDLRTVAPPPPPSENEKTRQVQTKSTADVSRSRSDKRVPRQISNNSLGIEASPPKFSVSPKKTTLKESSAKTASQSPVQSRVSESTNHQNINGFRLPNKARSNIRRGKVKLNGASGQRDIVGNSKSSHRINAATQSAVHNNYLVYVGRLAANTSCDDVRCHLSDVNIVDVSDVLVLSGVGSSRERSFCVSLGNKESMEKMFNPLIWPTGTVVRPYRPARARRPKAQLNPERGENISRNRRSGRYLQRRFDTKHNNVRWRNNDDSHSLYRDDFIEEWCDNSWSRNYSDRYEQEYYA